MKNSKSKSDALYVRVTPEFKRQFTKAAAKFAMQPSEVVRELAQAFVDGRVSVAPPSHVKEFYTDVD